MNFTAPRLIFKFLLIPGLPLVALGILAFVDQRPILIESLESKTAQLQPVFNSISFQPGLNRDIWVMRQSHYGPKAKSHNWDRIAIVVDKTVDRPVAQFYQLQPGGHQLERVLRPVAYRASCFMCHSNGPRAIRPNLDSRQAVISLWDRLRLTAWNLRIKSYGRIDGQEDPGMPRSPRRPFRHLGRTANQRLQVKTCQRCHNETGFLARGELTKQNFTSIRFMVEQGYMPPFGFSMSADERAMIDEFVGGLGSGGS